MKKLIVKILDLLYIKQIQKIVPKQTFYYAMCGGSNMVLDMVIYAFIHNFVLDQSNLEIFGFLISPAIASFIITFPIIFVTGLWLGSKITFTNSINSGRKQTIRYFTVTVANILIKYFGIKLLTTALIWPSFANATMTIVTVIFSYLMQKYYTFKSAK